MHLEHRGALDDLEQAAEVARLLQHLVAGGLGDAEVDHVRAAARAGVVGEELQLEAEAVVVELVVAQAVLEGGGEQLTGVGAGHRQLECLGLAGASR